jgi:hypothetical protein
MGSVGFEYPQALFRLRLPSSEFSLVMGHELLGASTICD